MIKGKALRRALASSQPERLTVKLPHITDATECITPEKAQEYLTRNRKNRPINWKKVEEYADIMARGDWQLHAQGIIFDPDGDILTGQTRLWAIVYSGRAVYMRVSRGTPRSAQTVIDRGRPQSARDLAARTTERVHSPSEASLARAAIVLRGILRPSPDQLACLMVEKSEDYSRLLEASKGTRKTRSVLMVLAALSETPKSRQEESVKHLERLAEELERRLAPQTAQRCWGRGAAFSLAMEAARSIVTPSK